MIGLSTVFLSVVIIAIPLYDALEIAVDQAQVTAAANRAVDDWLGDTSLELFPVGPGPPASHFLFAARPGLAFPCPRSRPHFLCGHLHDIRLKGGNW